MHKNLQLALTGIELREARLLAWGAVGAEWQRDELTALLDDYCDGDGSGDTLLDDMVELAVVVETPGGGYRSRSAETIRLLATMRQAFRNEAIMQGRPLVLDYRFLQRPRRRPRREVSAASFIESVADRVGVSGRRVLDRLTPPMVSTFQVDSAKGVLDALSASEPTGVVVTAGTGSGKTLSFYLPMIAWIADQAPGRLGETVVLSLYPRVELLKDQLRTLVTYALGLRESGISSANLSLAAWFGPTPKSAFHIRQGWESDWRRTSTGFICPFLRCPTDECEGDLVWPHAEIQADAELLRCTNCGLEIPGSLLRLTRDSALARPAHMMLSTTESLNRQLSSPASLRAFGVSSKTLRAVLLDEVHTYQGTTGAQNAYLLRRLRKALGYAPLWAGLSATLTGPADFFGGLVDLAPGQVGVIEPNPDQLEESGAEYLVALRHNPHGNTGTLSTTIQAAMLISRTLDPLNPDPFDPPPNSDAIFGRRLFAFTDKLDSTNRLYWDLLDAEGWAYPGTPRQGAIPLTLAHLRSESQRRLSAGRQEASADREPAGQHWWLAEQLGHRLDGDAQKHVGRTSSQDRGVTADADIIVATASLEVGFDDERVGAVLQHKAPHDAAQFLQRKGRAGRDARTRPWTVVVLSDWGRDREAWDGYDALFSPVVPERTLPLGNLYVLRIQAVYTLLDWLAAELPAGSGSSWEAAAGPADLLFPTNPKREQEARRTQERMEQLLGALLRDGPERSSLVRHLRRSLALGTDSAADLTLEKLLWESPRPLLASVVPTLRRRLRDGWAGERPTADDTGVRTRTPLRDFAPGNLFDELLVPDVELIVPWAGNQSRTEYLPALRAIREFLPGNVSRHFGVRASNKRHWVPLPTTIDSAGVALFDVAAVNGLPVDNVDALGGPAKVFVPTRIGLQAVPNDVSDASSMRADWQFHGEALGIGARLPVVPGLAGLLQSFTAHLHSQGGGLRVVRFAETAKGTLWRAGQALPQRIRFVSSSDSDDSRTAIGVELHADAMQGQVVLPQFDGPVSPLERAEWVRELITRRADFPDAVSNFDRAALADAVDVAAAEWNWDRTDPTESEFADKLWSAATRLGTVDPADPGALAGWIRSPQIAKQLRKDLLASRAPTRDAGWVEWAQQRFTLAVAEAVVQALSAGNPRVDLDELSIDLDPTRRGAFYVSEQSPGGTGQIEALAAELVDHPERLPVALADVLRPTDAERVDLHLRTVIDSSAAGVGDALRHLHSAWQMGHDAVRAATEALDEALLAANVVVGRAARLALSSRLAGPGSSPNFVDEVREWLRLRDAAEAMSGFALSPRTLSALLANRGEVDPFLHLASPTETDRARSVANVLWPWGTSARPTGSYSPYSTGLTGAIDLVREHWALPIEILPFTEWNAAIRSRIHDALRQDGEIILSVPVSARSQMRKAILDLHTNPVEVGPLWCYPEILGVQTRDSQVDARVVLREAW